MAEHSHDSVMRSIAKKKLGKPQDESRRKYTRNHDPQLLKKVQATGTHLAERGKAVDTFELVAANLNGNKSLPWPTEAKHCSDRFKLILRNYRNYKAAQGSDDEVEMEPDERDQLCQDLVVDQSELQGVRRKKREEEVEKEVTLQRAGSRIRDPPMKRSAARMEGSTGRSSGSSPSKRTRTRSHVEIGRAVGVFKEAKRTRSDIARKAVDREGRRLEMNEK